MVEVYQVLTAGLLMFLVSMVVWGRIERHWISLAVVLVLLITCAIDFNELLVYVDWDVIGLILGMSILTVYLEDSGLMDIVSLYLVKRLKTPVQLVFWLSFVAGLVSIALENVTVVLLFTPIAFRLTRSMGLNPIPVIIGIALASNMAGSATMIGDPPAIITAGYLDLVFTDFIWYEGKPSMFFFTLIPMILACLTLSIISRKSLDDTKVYSYRKPVFRTHHGSNEYRIIDKAFLFEALFFLSIKIILLSIRHVIHLSLSIIALVAVGGLSILRLMHRDYGSVKKALTNGFEWRLALFLIGVFSLSGAFAKYGLATLVANWIITVGSGDIIAITSLLVWVSVLVSAFIDNVPYTATMLPVITLIAENLGVEPITIAWALLLGTTLGGNLTYIGASANVTGVRMLEKQGFKISFFDFMKISIPFNTVSVVTGWLLYEIFWIILA